MSDEIANVDQVVLPKVSEHTAPLLVLLTEALGVDRAMLPSDEEIDHAWSNLPRLLSRIPPELRNEGLMRMCVAVANGLFDSGINYAWNAAILELRNKVRNFGIYIIPQIIDEDFDENKLLDLQDSRLLNLCLKLNLISEHGYFMLDQCRDIRNNFSNSHPTIGPLDEDEFISFVNRVGRYALNSEQNPQAVNIQELISAVNASSFSDDQHNVWRERIDITYEAQRETIFGMLHGIYCDSSKGEEARLNSLAICKSVVDKFTPSIKSLILNRHQDYQAKGHAEKHTASQKFFKDLGLINLLSDSEQHSIVSNACQRLLSAHNGYDNFYNEFPFAERLADIIEDQTIPASAQVEFVQTVLVCAAGNRYGISRAAYPYYEKMIQGFSPREVLIMLELPESNNILSQKINLHPVCKNRFTYLVGLINEKSVTPQSKTYFDKWRKTS